MACINDSTHFIFQIYFFKIGVFPMEVSSFELIYKPQSPLGDADTVLQGYFLNITNLEDKELTFQVNFITSSVSDPDRRLADNTTAIIDTPNVNNTFGSLTGSLTTSSFALNPSVVIAPDETAKIALLPSDPFPSMPTDPFPFMQADANFEARGYVTLRLRPRLVRTPGGLSFEPQLDRPARVMITPQNRATYFSSTGEINDQTQAGLPPGPGGAVAEVEAETSLIIVRPDLFKDGLLALENAQLPDFSEKDFALMLGALSASDFKFSDVNAALKDAGIGMALENRKL
jgi:hypothetical protein